MPQKKKRIWTPLTFSQLMGLGILLLLTVATISILHHIDTKYTDTQTDPTDNDIIIETIDLEKALIQDSIYRHNKYKKPTIPYNPHTFNPNTADSITLLEQGIPHWIVRNMLRYRANGGKYQTAERLRSTYGMTDSLYNQLLPYIDIPIDTSKADTTFVVRTYTIKRDTIIELNNCDTTDLKLLHGIGSYTAKQIVAYRERLGGYYHLEQLKEIEILQDKADSLYRFFTIDTTLIHKIDVNTASINKLRHHPYLRYEQAEAIYQRRRSNYKLHSIEEIKSIKNITEEDIERLRPYLEFK